MQRAAVNASSVNTVPSIVHDVLKSPGQPLDAGTRAFMEQRFGQNFSQVRVHTDARAAELAQAVKALVYTVSKDMVFGTGLYAPETSGGRRLIAHELTHVMQQDQASSLFIRMGQDNDSYECAATQTATMLKDEWSTRLVHDTTVNEQPMSIGSVPALQRQKAVVAKSKNMIHVVQREVKDGKRKNYATRSTN